MGLFTFFKNKNNNNGSFNPQAGLSNVERPEITRETFIQDEKPSAPPVEEKSWNIGYLYEFISVPFKLPDFQLII